MISKIAKPGRSFKGCVEYNSLKDDAVILEAIGVRTDEVSHIINDFNLQRKMNPALGQAVGHIALAWSQNDAPKLTDELMLEIGNDYLKKMNIQNTQLLMVRHHDKQHPHLHIIYNRVDNNGKTIPDKFQHLRSVKICKELTLKHGFYLAEGKANVNRQQLKGADKIRYELFDIIGAESKQSRSMEELQQRLNAKGITMHYKYKSGTEEVQGISFVRGNYKFKGSEIDRSLSYGKLSALVEQNRGSQQMPEPAKQTTQRTAEKQKVRSPIPPSPGRSFLDMLLKQETNPQMPQLGEETDGVYRKKGKKKRPKPNL